MMTIAQLRPLPMPRNGSGSPRRSMLLMPMPVASMFRIAMTIIASSAPAKTAGQETVRQAGTTVVVSFTATAVRLGVFIVQPPDQYGQFRLMRDFHEG